MLALLVLFGVELGMLVSVACHKEHFVQQDILVHLIQHITNGAKTGFVVGMKDANLETRFTQTMTLRFTAYAVFGIRQGCWLSSWWAVLCAKGDFEDAIAHVPVASFDNAIDGCAAPDVSSHVAGQCRMLGPMSSHEVFTS